MTRNFAAKRLAVAILAVATAGGTAGAAPAIRLVQDGRPRAVLVLSADCAAKLRPAAELLAKYVKLSSTAELPMVVESESAIARQPVVIHLGLDAYAKALGLGVEKLDADGFVIRGVDERNLVIAGPTPEGTEFGVCEFLERYLGVRWLLPGPDGDDVPEHRTLEIPFGEIRQEPAFFSRLFSGLVGEAQSTWARRNRMHGRVQFHHNLVHLFPPEQYAKTHPEFFPLRDGKRYLPADSSVHGWQPCCSAAGIVDEAIKNICLFFQQHPEATSYSLGVNDSSGHCQCQACQGRDPGGKNFLGFRDCSDRYFAWCNQIVEGVLKQYPDKVFGCLAYSEVGEAPSRVKVHPRIIPFMTYDRMKWSDADLRADGQRMTRRWHEVCPVLGWYDYIYGSPYCLPRVWFHEMADDYRFGYANGVRAMYAEAYPNWGEGPKLYVSLKLQWNPRQDVDALLRDWYARAVGPDAAGELAAYYAHWEDFWTRRIHDSQWFSKSGQYLAFYNPAYLADVSEEEIAASRSLLERTMAKARTAPQKARAKLLLRAFEYYEASAYAFGGQTARVSKTSDGKVEKAPLSVPATEADALALLERGYRSLQMARRRQRLVAEFAADPLLVHPLGDKTLQPLGGPDGGAGLFWRALDWAEKSESVRRELQRLARSQEPAAQMQAKAMLAVIDPAAAPVSQDPSFETLKSRWPVAWRPWINDRTGSLTALPEAAHRGKIGILCKGIKRGGPYQDLPAAAGRYAATAFLRVPLAPQGKATITLSVTPIDENGKNMGSLSTTIRATRCDWTRIAVAGAVPPEAGKADRVKKLRLVVIVDGLEPSDEVHVDDVALYKIE